MMPRQLLTARRPKRAQPRLVLEELPSIDCRMLARQKLFPKGWGENILDNFGLVVPAVRSLTLGPRRAIITLHTRSHVIPVHWQRITGACNSQRPMFQCPCGRRAFKLYLHHGSLGCYRCLGIPYACQQRSAKRRGALQAIRLRQFLGSHSDSTPRRPPLMHKTTHDRLTAKLHRLEAKLPRKQRSISTLGHKLTRPTQRYRARLASITN